MVSKFLACALKQVKSGVEKLYSTLKQVQKSIKIFGWCRSRFRVVSKNITTL